MRPKSPTTTTKHPHLSVVQVFKESLPCRSEEARLCRTYITLSSISRIFFAPPRQKHGTTRPATPDCLSLPAPLRLHSSTAALEEVRIIDNQILTSRKKQQKTSPTNPGTPAPAHQPQAPRRAKPQAIHAKHTRPASPSHDANQRKPPPLHPTTANGRSDRHRAPMAIALRCATCVVPASRELLCSPRRSMPGALSFATMARADASVAVAAPWGK